MEFLTTPGFWVAVGQVIMIDILLGGDNAVVIALACRSLPPETRNKGIVFGAMGAILLRVVLIFFALALLTIPYLKLVGGVLLLWIGIKLILPQEDEAHGGVEGSSKLWSAIRTVIVADLVMSVDNVIAIAGAADGTHPDGQMVIVVFGLLVSIPIIIGGSKIVLGLMDRFPLVIVAGGLLLGWIAGTMAVSDPALVAFGFKASEMAKYAAGIGGALLVLVIGKSLARRKKPAVQASGHTAEQTSGQ